MNGRMVRQKLFKLNSGTNGKKFLNVALVWAAAKVFTTWFIIELNTALQVVALA